MTRKHNQRQKKLFERLGLTPSLLGTWSKNGKLPDWAKRGSNDIGAPQLARVIVEESLDEY